jgi:hypothetical protein
MRRATCLLAALLTLPVARADQVTALDVCFNYSCLTTQTVLYSEAHIGSLRKELQLANDAAEERLRLQDAVARMYRWAGEQSPIHVDRAGDFLDDGVYGRMDCIDHARTTERMLETLQEAGALRFHRAAGIERRRSWLIMQHFSATIEQNDGGGRWAVDTWFRDHAEPAVVMDIEEWKDGGYPDE